MLPVVNQAFLQSEVQPAQYPHQLPSGHKKSYPHLQFPYDLLQQQ